MKEKNTAPKRRRITSPGIRINRICLSVCVVLFVVVCGINLFRRNRPTVSESENRALAKWPAFSTEALFDGSYFSGISDFFSDTFPARDWLIRFANSLNRAKGFTVKVNGVEYEVLPGGADPGQEDPQGTETEPGLIDFTLPTAPTTQAPQTTEVPQTTGTTGTEGPQSTEAGTTSASETTAPIPFAYTALRLSRTEISLENLKSFTLRAQVETVGKGTAEPVTWSVSAADAVLSGTDGNTATFLPLRAGTYTVTAKVGELSASCAVSVASSNVIQANVKPIQSTMFYYDNSFYQTIGYSGNSLKTCATNMGNLEKLYGYYWPKAKLYLLPAPHTAVQLDPTLVSKAGRDQNEILNDIAACLPEEVTLVNAVTPIKAHPGEYLYYRTDHHWTPLGAYYAYTAFADAAGWSPIAFSSLQSRTVRSAYIGPAYYNSAISKNVTPDVLKVYYPTKSHTMRVYYNMNDAKSHKTAAETLPSCITDKEYNNFLVFLGGDIPYLHIDVPENGGENGKRILVVMDSYGRPFLPYLCEHYGSITAVNPRDYECSVFDSLKDLLADSQFDDILFVMNVQSLNNTDFINAAYNIIQ